MKSILVAALLPALCLADGLVLPPKNYDGSLAEKAQEAILVFQDGTETKSAVQDMVLKISVEGKAEDFAWIVPLPSVPETGKEDPKLFEELFDYVEARKAMLRKPKTKGLGFKNEAPGAAVDRAQEVEVIKKEVVGSFEIATVKENAEGGLLKWLDANGYRAPANPGEVLNFYREKGYVFACIKITEAKQAEAGGGSIEVHPLRFTFETGGRDGIFFPMKLTGLQEGNFDVNLHVFRSSWINDHINGYGFEHRGFRLEHRDWDTPKCKANAGKTWSLPERDPYLSATTRKVPTITKFFQDRHPGKKFYLTNIRARGLEAERVKNWKTDLWLFPYYTNAKFVPYDAGEGGVAAE